MANDLFKDHMLAMVVLGQHCLALELLARRLEPEHWARLIDETMAEVRSEFDGMTPTRLQELTARAINAILRMNGVDSDLLPPVSPQEQESRLRAQLQQQANDSGETVRVTRFGFDGDFMRHNAEADRPRIKTISTADAPPLEMMSEYTIEPQPGIAETPEGAEAARIDQLQQEQEF